MIGDATATWRMARRMVGWAPEAARALLTEASRHQTDDTSQATSSELLARAHAALEDWHLATRALQRAIELRRDLGDADLADQLERLLERFPVPGFSSEHQALEVELELIRRSIAGTSSRADRMTVEIARTLQPRRVAGNLQAWLGLSSSEMTLLSAAVASVADSRCGPPRIDEGWRPVLGDTEDGFARLLEARLVSPVPALIANPRIVSRMLGRSQLEPPRSVRMTALAPQPPSGHDASFARELRGSSSIGVVIGPAAAARAAAIATAAGLRAIAAEPRAHADVAMFADAALEAQLFGGLLVVDGARWRTAGLDLASTAAEVRWAPILVMSDDDPPIDRRFRAFTSTPEVSSRR
ncbi:MAG: hypothetical protein AB7P03_18410 [Kofleriaceae bacterium]